jgi:hypothetical protein
LLAVNQYEGIHPSRRDQPCGHCGLAKSSRSAEDPLVVFSNHGNSVLLRRAQLAAELHVNCTSRAPLVTDVWLDAMRFKQFDYLGQTPTRQSNVVGEILAARNYSRLVECGKPHCLGLVKFRILKCGQTKQTVQHRRRQPILLDIQKVCANDLNRGWKRSWYWAVYSLL